jgi:hypothetical protein
MGSRLTVQSNMGSDSIRVLPTGAGAAAASKTNSSNDQRSQVPFFTKLRHYFHHDLLN